MRRDDAVLIDQSDGGNDDADVVNGIHIKIHSCSDEAEDRYGVQRGSDLMRAGYAELRGHRMELVRDVEFVVLAAVDDIKAADPEADTGRQKDDAERQLSRHCEIAAGRSHGERHAEEVVAQAGEALGVRVEQQKEQTDRRELEADGRELSGGKEEQRQAHDDDEDGFNRLYRAVDESALFEAGLVDVEFQIDEVVHRERRAARADHRQRHPDEVVKARQPV